MSDTKKKIELAGDWLYNEELQKTAAALEAAGYELLCKWWEPSARKKASTNLEFLCARIDACDAFVFDVRGVPRDKNRKHAGGHLSMGYAIAKQKPVFFLGEPASSLYTICATTTEGLLKALETEFTESEK